MSFWLCQHANSGIAKLRPGEFLPVTSRQFNTAAERENYSGFPYEGKPLRNYSYVPDEIRHIPATFDELIPNGEPLYDSPERLIRLYGEEFSKDRFEFKIKTVMHASTAANCRAILEDGKLFFKPSQKGYNVSFAGNWTVLRANSQSKGLDPSVMASPSFLWFTPYLKKERKEDYLKFLEQRQAQIRRKWESNGTINIETAHRFSDFPRDFQCTTKPFGFVPYGKSNAEVNSAITVDFNDLLAKYCSIVGAQSLCATRFGTEVYQQEIMQAVVIHPPMESLSDLDRTILFQSQLMGNQPSQNHETILYHPTRPGIVDRSVIYDAASGCSNGEWFWKPYSTATDFSYTAGRAVVKRYGRWDHPAFAFMLPEAIRNNQADDRQGFAFSGLKWEALKLEVSPNPSESLWTGVSGYLSFY